MISQRSIQDVLNIAQIEDVVQDYVNLRRRGVNMLGLCPFHDEKSPSFTVSPAKNIYKCFGCGKGGNPINFIMEHEALSYPEAIRHLASKYGVELEESGNSDEHREEQQKAESLYLINKYASDHFNNNLLNTDEGKSIGLSYFKSRGFRMSTIETFDLGYSINEYKHFTEEATAKKYNLDMLKTLGLVSAKGYDFYRGRVMFPIHNLSGKVIGFGGRILTENKKAPKYVNSPESEIYNKRKTLYGIYQAKNEIRKQDFCILVEGYTDVISLHQSDVKNVVASSGTALTKDQIKLVKRYTNNITVIYDGDAAGIKAALRGMDLILEQDMNIRLVLLPDKEDPDSFVKSVGTTAFNEYLKEESKDFILFKTDLVKEEAGDDPIKKAALLKDIIQSISVISDTLKRSVYIQQCSRLLEIDENILVQETNKMIRGNIKKKQVEQDRERLREQYKERRSQTRSEKSPDGGFPSEPPPGYGGGEEYDGPPDETGYYEADHYDDSSPRQNAKQFAQASKPKDENQERDLARICVTFGNELYEPDQTLKVATFILDNIADLIAYFDNEVYKEIVVQAADLASKDTDNWDSYFTNHENEKIRNEAISLMSSPYVYANWESKEVELQTQKKPELNQQKDSYQAVLRFKLKKVKRIMENLSAEIKAMDHEDENFLINVKVLQKLQEQRNTIASELHTVIL